MCVKTSSPETPKKNNFAKRRSKGAESGRNARVAAEDYTSGWRRRVVDKGTTTFGGSLKGGERPSWRNDSSRKAVASRQVVPRQSGNDES